MFDKKSLNIDQLLLSNSLWKSLFEKLSDKAQETRVLNSTPVIEYLSLKDLLFSKEQSIKSIIRELKSEQYEFLPIYKIHIKQNDKFRQIAQMNWKDKIVLMALQECLQQYFKPYFSNSLYSFMKGRGPLNAISDVRNFLKTYGGTYHVLQYDIKEYGETIPRNKLIELVKRYGLDQNPLCFMLFQKALSLTACIKDENISFCNLIGIHSGLPIVPVLENMYLLDLDFQLSTLKNSRYFRYGDDFLFITTNKQIYQQSQEIIDKTVDELQLTISEEKKNRITLTPSNSFYFEWIGYSFHSNGQVGPRKKHYQNIKTSLKTKIKQLFTFYKANNISFEQMIEILAFNYNEIIAPITNPSQLKLIQFRELAGPIKALDTQLRHTLVREISRTYNISRKESWKTIRQLKLYSLNHNRRKSTLHYESRRT